MNILEFEKTAIKSGFVRRVMSQFRSGGAKGGINYLSKFKDPTHALPLGKGNVPKNIPIQGKQKVPSGFNRGGLKRGVRTSMGNMAENVRILTKGTEGKGLIGGTGQVIKNTGELIGRQVKGDTIKEITGPVSMKNGKKYIKSKNPFLKDREVISQTGRDSYLVRKRMGILPASVALGGSGASIGAASYALSDKKKPKSKRLQTAARDTALFTAGIPIGIAGMIALDGNEQKKINKKNKNKLGE